MLPLSVGHLQGVTHAQLQFVAHGLGQQGPCYGDCLLGHLAIAHILHTPLIENVTDYSPYAVAPAAIVQTLLQHILQVAAILFVGFTLVWFMWFVFVSRVSFFVACHCCQKVYLNLFTDCSV